MSKSTKEKRYWKITVAAAVILTIITFTPIVIAPGKIKPALFSMPYTLWVSILLTIILVVLTYIGGMIHLKDNDKKK